MTEKKVRIYSGYSTEAAILLGKQVKLGRKQRRWSEAELAQRADISVSTVKRIEKGDMSCAIGLVFEVAALVGIKLFSDDHISVTALMERTDDKIALLPKTIHSKRNKIDDNF